MRRERSEAIILHTYPAREKDKVVVFITPGMGKRRGWAYGARGAKSRFGAALEPLAKVEIRFMEKEGDELVRIESVDLIRSLFPAQQDLGRSLAATYLAEMIDTFAQAEDPSELLYRLLDRASAALLAGAMPLPVIAYVEIWTLKVAGLFPSIRKCAECQSELSKPLRFDLVRGTFLCASCGNALIVPNETALALASLLGEPIEAFAASQRHPEILLDIRSIARQLRRSFLGQELRSHDVVTTLLARQ